MTPSITSSEITATAAAITAASRVQSRHSVCLDLLFAQPLQGVVATLALTVTAVIELVTDTLATEQLELSAQLALLARRELAIVF